MRFKVIAKGGYSRGSLGPNGGEVNSRIALSRNPVETLEAATKNYADSSVRNIYGDIFDRGMLSVNVLPPFEGGSVLKEAGENVIHLKETNVTASSWTKYDVSYDGRIHDAFPLEENDIPPLPWSRVNSNTPSTLNGYGILNGIKNTGGTLVSRINIPIMGGLGYSLVTKSYADLIVEEVLKPDLPGTIKYSVGNRYIEGHLLCNGASLPVEFYLDLYLAIGDRFTDNVDAQTFNIPNIEPVDGLYSYIKT